MPFLLSLCRFNLIVMDFEIFAYINYACNVIILFGVGVRFPQFALNRSGFFLKVVQKLLEVRFLGMLLTEIS